MHTNFQVIGIDKNEFNHLFEMDEKELNKLGAVRQVVESSPGSPCRVSLEDAKVGEEVILFPYEHHNINSPYRSKGPVFIREVAQNAQLNLNEIPKMLVHRLLSLRAYDKNGMMLNALTVEGVEIEKSIQDIFSDEAIAYIHVHNSGPGCFNCEVRRS